MKRENFYDFLSLSRREDLIYMRLEKNKVILERSIWPDVDGPTEVNEFLRILGIKVNFLLDSGLEFSYDPSTLEPYAAGEGRLFFRNPVTKEYMFHYYEDIGELVFENLITKVKYRIPIYDDLELAEY